MSATRHYAAERPFEAVVVVGSQGALRSFQGMLGRLPTSFPAAIVFDLHRGEGYGAMARVIARSGDLPVRLVADGSRLASSIVFLTPHDRQVTVSDRRLLSVCEQGDGSGHRTADALLASAAHVFGPRLIAVVLSGRLDGGAEGVREVRRHGGRVLVEDPKSAEAPSMPRAALATGCVDFALSPAGLADLLVVLCAVTGGADLFRVRLNAAVAG